MKRSTLALDLAVLAAAFLAGFSRIADLDFWWHLKAGQVIAQSGKIPRTDLFSFTARGAEYVDHEWLFQLVQWWTWSAAGALGIAILKCLVIGITFVLVARACVRDGAHPLAAFGLVALGMAGAVTRLIERPEIFSTLFTVITVLVLRTRSRRLLVVLPMLCALWANVHAAVIVGLVIQMLFILATAGGRLARRSTGVPPVDDSSFDDSARRDAARSRPGRPPSDGIVPLGAAFAGSVIASGLNPFGYRVLSVPFELTSIIHSGIVENDEWKAPTLRIAPVFWITLVAVAIVLLLRIRKTPAFNLLLFAFLAFLAVRYVRNIGLFCTLMPLLVSHVARPMLVLPAGVAALAFASTIYFPFQRGIGEASYFPDRLATFVEERALRGNMLNSYGFGGYLIWRLYPERSVFIDGRNEVYVPLLERMQTAQMDSRAWRAMLRDFRIEYAVLEYVDRLDQVVLMNPDGSRAVFPAAVTSIRFPRNEWALVQWDDDGMIFVRRRGPNRIDGEYRFVHPEGTGYQRMLIDSGRVRKDDVLAELHRKLREDPGSRRARALLDQNR